MNNKSAWLHAVLLGVIGVMPVSEQASAALVLNQETLANSSGTAVTTTLNSSPTVLSTPSSTFYGNTFNAPQTNTFTVGSNPTGWGFYDDFFINITGSTANSITSTINLGSLLNISMLEVRLYSGSSTILGNPGASLISGWTTPVSYQPGITGLINVINPTVLSAGNYVLEVRGIATGTAGGSYSGVFNLAPVPVPAAVYLLGSGLLGLFSFSRRAK